jgi:hypothetical protein
VSRQEPVVSNALHRCIPFTHNSRGFDINAAIDALRGDQVVLVRNVSINDADDIVYKIAEQFDLLKTLEVEANFSYSLDQRRQIKRRSKISKYFVSVGQIGDYQFHTPHSEGSSITNIQLSCFFCFENSTDGGDTILTNVNEASEEWGRLREQVTKILPGSKPLSRGEAVRARALYRLRSSDDYVVPDDRIVQELQATIPGLRLASVLARAQKAYSIILKRDVNVLWSTIGNVDQSSLEPFARMLQHSGLLKMPAKGLEFSQLDLYFPGRIWRSGADYTALFRDRIVLKLRPGDLVIQNNLTWPHAVNNWTPDSGSRRIAAAFA